MQKVRVIAFQGVQNLPILLALDQGYFSARGLDVEVSYTPNSWTLRDGLAAGTFDIAHTAVDNAIAMVDVAEKDVAVVMGGDSGYNAVIAQPTVDSIDSLRGRKVLVDAPNTAFALVMYKILALHGIHRGQYEVQSVGATPLRLAAMQKDAAASATIMNLPYRVIAEGAGFRNFGDATGFIGPYLSTACFVMRPWGRANDGLLVRYMQAYVKGLRHALADSAYSVNLLCEGLKIEAPIASRAYGIATAAGGFAKDAALDLNGLENVLKLRAEIEGQGSEHVPSTGKYFDLSYYQEALATL